MAKRNFESLRDFIKILEENGKLKRVSYPVSANLEMTEIQRRLLAKKGEAVIFENPLKVDGSKSSMPVLANLFGTTERVAMAMGCDDISDLRKVGQTLAFFKNPTPPTGFKEALKMLPMAKDLLAIRPKKVSKAPVQEIVITGDDVDLNSLPISQCWADEPAPLITWGLTVTQGLAKKGEDSYNMGVYRLQVLGKNRTCMRWLKHRGGAQHFARWQKEKPNAPMPCAVVIGASPSTIISAVTPIPENVSEYQFAGLLSGERIRLVDCKTIPLQVPANAEIILEGHILANETALEGPYGDHTGYYNSQEEFPIFEISAITMRKDPIYQTTFTGRPPDEPSVLAEALNEVFIPLLQQQYPEILDFYLPPEGCSYRIAVVSIKKAYAGHGRRIMMGVWSYLRQFLYTKFIIIVDEDINIRDWKDIMWAVSTRSDPSRDVMMINNTPIDYLDFASPLEGLGGKMGIDATNKIANETSREWGKKLEMDQETITRIDDIWQHLGL